jgi:hypothetical protein
MTIVGLVPPVYEEGQLLIDGGYLNNIPVDVMRSMGVDMVRDRSLIYGLCLWLAPRPSVSCDERGAHRSCLLPLFVHLCLPGR